MSSHRPKIPAEIAREVLIQSGHRCAVCGDPCPLEFAHIIPWRKSKDHSVENLICLCANCHQRADYENWGEKTLREYKKQPWILKSKEINYHMKVPSKFTLKFEIAYEDFDAKHERMLIYALSGFLDIPPESIKIIAKEEGSVIVTLELPSNCLKNLSRALRDRNQKLINSLKKLRPVLPKDELEGHIMIIYDSCPYCGREAKDAISSNWFPIHTCLDCDTKYCEEDGPPCPDCHSSNYGDYGKVCA